MQTLLYNTLQYVGALLPSLAIGLLIVLYALWIVLRECAAWIVGKGVGYS